MSCPHGSGPADKCSICLGIVAKKITYSPDRIIMVDGVATIPIASEKQAYVIGNPKLRRCAKCRRAGHTARTCKFQEAIPEE